ncbi:hypothetical protein BDV59DRAFT_2697 [Aspergillus ambiguus]|uniref:uncharacterized protein n=1 Tax=Aspergillus ambiguus TaxID=176160 RepID=UPI003CCE1BDC
MASRITSLHIATTPAPRNLAESKLVLSALQKFGEVVTFRNLKYDTTNTSMHRPRATIAIYESADCAARALAASPLRIPLSNADLVCDIQPARHNHHSAMRRNPVHGPFTVDRRSERFRDLSESGLPVEGLAGGGGSAGGAMGVSETVRRRVMRENERLGAGSLKGLYVEGVRMAEIAMEQGQEQG